MHSRPASLPRLARRIRRRATGEQGDAVVEFVVIFALFWLLGVMAFVQFILWGHATNIANATATDALAATRAQGGSVAAGRAEAHDVSSRIGGTVLTDPTITVTRTPGTAHVEVTGTALRVVPIPGLRLPVRAAAEGSVERFLPDPRATTPGAGR